MLVQMNTPRARAHPYVYDVFARTDEAQLWSYGGRAQGPGEALVFMNYIRARGLQCDVRKVDSNLPEPVLFCHQDKADAVWS